MPPATASVIIPQRNFLNFNAAIVHSITIAMLCSNSFSISRVAAAVPSSTSSPSTSSANSSLDKDHKYNCCEKDSPKQEKLSQHNRGNFLTKRLALPSSSSKRMTDDEMAMVQKSIESRSQRSRRAGGITSKADINQFLKESSRRYRPATRLTSVASLESTASDLLAADRTQANELPNVEQLSLAETQQRHVGLQHESHPTDSAGNAQPRRKRSSLLRRLSSTLQRDTSMTRYDSFEGHRDSLEIVRRQIQANGIAYRPRIPHPNLDDVDYEEGGGKCSSNESGTKNGATAEDIQVPADTIQTPAGESSKDKQGEDMADRHHVLNNSDVASVASQEDTTAILPMHVRPQDTGNRGHHKINANINAAPLPPQLQNDKVGYARSA